MAQECRFAAVMNWLTALAASSDAEVLQSLLHALHHGADNADGLDNPRFIIKTYSDLPTPSGSAAIPNYIDKFLTTPQPLKDSTLNIFQDLWREALINEPISANESLLTIFEPACGSANDYRFLNSFGIAPLSQLHRLWTSAPKTSKTPRSLFPKATFSRRQCLRNPAPDNAFDISFVHDLFETPLNRRSPGSGKRTLPRHSSCDLRQLLPNGRDG